MFDLHYDLLSVCYVCYLKGDYSYLEEWCKSYREDNVKGVIANLYFMSLDEMKRELHPNYYQEEVSVVEMFRISTSIAKNFLPDTELLFSIEGCDYIEVSDLDDLYDLGLRNILPVWNCQNKYASGNRSDGGLTEEGKRLLDKAIELGISIDLSHANKKSFYDMTNYLVEKKRQGYQFLVMASHSNSRSLCDRDRNLDDEQVLRLKEVDGLLGVFSNRNFIVDNEKKNIVGQKEKELDYLAHVSHMVDLLGVSFVGVSSDDMDFCKESDSEYGELSIFSYSSIASRLSSLLKKKYDDSTVYQIMYGNMKKRYDILSNENMKGMRK